MRSKYRLRTRSHHVFEILNYFGVLWNWIKSDGLLKLFSKFRGLISLLYNWEGFRKSSDVGILLTLFWSSLSSYYYIHYVPSLFLSSQNLAKHPLDNCYKFAKSLLAFDMHLPFGNHDSVTIFFLSSLYSLTSQFFSQLDNNYISPIRWCMSVLTIVG